VLEERITRPDRASLHYYEALRVDPGFAPARSNLARLLFANGQTEEALLQFQRLVEVAPNDPSANAGLVETLLRLGRMREADQLLAAAAAHFPDAPELSLLNARRELRLGQFDAACERLSPLATRRDEFGAAALGWLATGELARGRPRQAVSAATAALSLVPESSVATYTLAVALSKLRSPDAEAWLKRARSLAPRDPLLARLVLGVGRPRAF
jgi:Flp pilus assembly protein TadD